MTGTEWFDEPELTGFTAEWFSAAMIGSGFDARVTDVRFEPLEVADVGWFARMFVAHLGYEVPGTGPASVVLKVEPLDEGVRTMGFEYGLFPREVGFYRDLAGLVPLRVPRCDFADLQEERQRYVLVLEDLSAGRFGSQVAGCTPAEAADLAEELAVLHAWCSDRDMPSWLTPIGVLGRGFVATYPDVVGSFVDRYRGRVPDRSLETAKHLVGQLDDVYDALAALPATLAHGDFRLDNVAFDVGDDRRPVLYDWQTATIAPFGLDLASLVVLSLDSDVRRSSERTLLDGYRASRVAHGAPIDAEELELGYRLSVIHYFLLGICAEVQKPDHPNYRVWCERTAHAVASIDVETLI